MNAQVQIIERDGEPEYAVVPIEIYRRLVAMAEDAEDIGSADRAMAELTAGEDELIPDEVVSRLLAGENPVKVWRKYRGMSQVDLATAVGLSQGYIAQIETGKREGTIANYRAFSQVLAVDLDDLVPPVSE